MKILLLAGTSEARALARALQKAGHEVIASLAGATRSPTELGCETRIGGFGGREGFLAWLTAHVPDLIIDATHPFAAKITARSAQICAELGVPYLLVLRPHWPIEPASNQQQIERAEDALPLLPPRAHVFLATGRQTLESFRILEHCTLFCRQIDPPDAPFPFKNGRYVIGKPPFSVEEEIELFAELKIDALIVKNSGGAASASKLEAAKRLGILTLMIKRPIPPDAPIATTTDEAMAWVASHADH